MKTGGGGWKISLGLITRQGKIYYISPLLADYTAGRANKVFSQQCTSCRDLEIFMFFFGVQDFRCILSQNDHIS